MKSIQSSIVMLCICILYLNCSKESTSETNATAATGTGGSLARFVISGNYLYIANSWNLKTYDISDPSNAVYKSSIFPAFQLETIFPYKDKLFLGSSNGMFIYSLADPATPKLLGSATHLRSCDPVVVNDSIAYVTLRGGTRCGPAEDGLYTYTITDVTNPVQRSLLKLSNPYGLGLKDTVVFVCRGQNGLTAVNMKNPGTPASMYTLTDANYMDVIPYDDILICYVNTGIILYDISNLNKLKKIGSMIY